MQEKTALAQWQSSTTTDSVRGVEGSCAKHLTIEFYMVVMMLTFILILICIPSPSLSLQAQNLPFLQSSLLG